MTGVDIDGRPYKLIVARWKDNNAITGWWGPYREQDAEAERERLARGFRDDVVLVIEDDRPMGTP